MREVELDDTPAVPAGPPRRRHTRLLIAVGVAAVVALVGGQLVVDARERAATAGVAGLLDDLASPPHVLWADSAQGSPVWRGPLDDERLVELRIVDDGSQQLSARSATTGEPLWTSTLTDPSPALAAARATGARIFGDSACAVSPGGSGAPPEVVCLVTDGFMRLNPQLGVAAASQSITTTPTRTHVEVIDGEDGSIAAQWPVGGSALLLSGRGQVVVAGSTSSRLEVSAYSLDGDPRWTLGIPLAVPEPGSLRGRTTSLVRSGSDIAVETFGTRVVLDGHGRLVRDDVGRGSTDGGFAVRDHLLQLQDGAGSWATTTLVAADEPADVTVAGVPVRIGDVDDGSLPDIVLTAGAGLRAWDAGTGTPRWRADGVRPGHAAGVVLDGTVYVPTASGVVAVDGRSGRTLWESALSSPDLLATDGRLVLVASSATRTLAAYEMSTGRPRWSVPYPLDVRTIEQIGGRLYGERADQSLVALVSP